MNTITTEIKGHILLIGLNRPQKMNAFTNDMLNELANAYTELEDHPNLRCGVLFAHGKHFSAGLDLAEVAPRVRRAGTAFATSEQVDPMQIKGRPRSKPVVVAVQGYCLTLSIELILANDICIAAQDSKFGQIEVKRGIFPFEGATLRFPQRCGWGNAMRYMLTGDLFDAQEALRIGLIQEVTATKEAAFDKALHIAETIANQAPLGVQATIINARKAIEEGEAAAIADFDETVFRLLDSEDAKEGVASFVERRKAEFKGR